ncbi:MAG: hypothetical protein ACAI38_01780 [Myxococcota bacterium]
MSLDLPPVSASIQSQIRSALAGKPGTTAFPTDANGWIAKLADGANRLGKDRIETITQASYAALALREAGDHQLHGAGYDGDNGLAAGARATHAGAALLEQAVGGAVRAFESDIQALQTFADNIALGARGIR